MSEEGLIYVFAWHALTDACPKCQQLNGREWKNPDLYQEKLWDPIWGDVWDFNMGSLAHPNCRCQLETRVSIDTAVLFAELKRVLLELRDKLLAMKKS